ncbi:PREDICTED: mu-type opioid receptor isoform X2 [Elephantulus edwardii]|uniref:mu-type opioid receptor isoform X2 n=1 Tax=Elephantulus edwardii TaxID=28737 RepID=UPI0003F090AB|nr:PREDICTED: mu-type opioid receptor isoform X2 [Elephantulus edwardii]
MDSSTGPVNASNCSDPFLRAAGCSPASSPRSWVNLSHLDDNQSDPCGPNRTELGGSDGLCPPAGSPSMITAITIMALYSIVCVLGLFGNFLVMYVIVRFHRLHPHVFSPNMVLGEPAENLRLHLRLHHACPHHHRVLWADDLTTQECTHAVWLQREGQEPAKNHQDGAGGGGCVHCLLDSHPHLCHHQSLDHHPGDHFPDSFLALLHCSRLHQQLPEPGPLCVSG